MAEIFPFRAWRYDPKRVRLADVLTQPYDKITPEMQQSFLAASPYNFIRVEKGAAEPGDGEGNNVYTRARATLEEWIRDNVIARDAEPAIYPYFQQYTVPGTRHRRTRKGFIALGRLEDYDAKVIFRHERTLPAPRADRLELLRHTRTQTGLLFLVYSDPERTSDRILAEAAERDPIAELTDENGVEHRLWALADGEKVAALAALLGPKPLMIADGHHRYETALTFRDECRREGGRAAPDTPCEKAMMALFNTESEGLTILPTHRLISGVPAFDFRQFRRRIEPFFEWYGYPFSGIEERETALAEFRHDLEGRGRTRRAIGAYAGGGAFYLFLLRGGVDLERTLPGVDAEALQLDVVLLHRLMIERGLGVTQEQVSAESRVGYEREFEAALGAVDSGSAQMTLLLNPPHIRQITAAAFAGCVLPEKSTDFYPKLLSGLALYRLDG
jgi:uncharacterized protein (DUF1015 family)